MNSRIAWAARCIGMGFAALGAGTAWAAPFAYIVHYSTNDISVIDTVTMASLGEIPVGTHPFAVSVTPNGALVLVCNPDSNTVSVIATASNTVVATLAAGNHPYGVAVNPAGTRAYVANYSGANVGVINLQTLAMSNSIAVGGNPGGVAFNAAGTRAYVTNGGDNSVSVIDTASETVLTTISNVGASPWGVVFSNDGSLAYTANFSSAEVAVINTATNTVITRIPVGGSPVSIVKNAAGTRLYTANSGSDTVSVIDTGTNAVVTTIPVGRRPFGVSLHPSGAKLYVTNAGDFSVGSTFMEVDVATKTVQRAPAQSLYSGGVGNPITPFSVPGAPRNLSAQPGNQKATVSFDEPFSDGGEAILGYTASCGAVTQAGNASPIVLTGLTNGMSVACQVRASNAIGPGAIASGVNVMPGNVPAPPGLISAQRGNGSATVSFSLAANDGGYPVLQYKASCGAASKTGSASPLTVTGLSNGVSVNCSVTASNLIGDSAASGSQSVTPATVPDAPVLSQLDSGNGQATLTFTAGLSGGAAISHYTATCQPGGFSASGSSSPLTVMSLANGNTYDCSVVATNDVGAGAASNSLQVLPQAPTDLSVSVSNGTGYLIGGSVATYSIQVSNTGSNAVHNAHVVDAVGANVTAGNWTCSVQGGAQCAASGSGAIDVLVDLPAAASITLTLQVSVPTLPETPVTNTATVSVPIDIADVAPANNTATDGPDARGIFRSSFE